ncbi:MAG: MFS transporter [Candidatus Micrarchaeota archaeon]|nr:MFS transporter [Candidatus Micrarchaeota archaeon]
MAKNKEGKIGQNVITLGIVSFFTDVSSEMVFPNIALFLTLVLGAGKELVGLVEGVADSVASLVEIFSGYFSDKLGKRKQFVLFGYGLSSIVKIGIALSTTWWMVLIMRGLERIGKGLRESPRDAIIASSAGKEVRGRAFGLHRAMDTAGAVIGPLLAFVLLSMFGATGEGYRNVFLIAVIPAFMAVAVIVLFVREPAKAAIAPAKKTPFWEALRQMPKEYKTFLKVSLIFSLSYFSFAFFILRATDLGIKPEDVLLLYVFYNIVYALASVPGGWLSDKIGRKPVIAGAFALYAVICVGFALATTWWHAALLFGLYGIFVALVEIVNKSNISDMVKE